MPPDLPTSVARELSPAYHFKLEFYTLLHGHPTSKELAAGPGSRRKAWFRCHLTVHVYSSFYSALSALCQRSYRTPLLRILRSDFFCTVTVVMKRNALLGILEKLTGDHRTALEHELLELPRKQNGTAWHCTEQNGTECTMIARTLNGTVC